MPILEYLCENCHYHFERLVMGPQKPNCPACASVKLKRQVERFAQGRPAERPRSLNSDAVIAHARALLGDISTIPKYKTKGLGSPGKRARRSMVA